MTKSISSFVKTVSNAIYKTLYAQALQNKPGGMHIGGNHSGGQGSAPHMGGPSFNNSRDEFELKYAELSYGSSQLGSDSSLNNSGPRGGGGYMDRSEGRDDYRVSIYFGIYCL